MLCCTLTAARHTRYHGTCGCVLLDVPWQSTCTGGGCSSTSPHVDEVLRYLCCRVQQHCTRCTLPSPVTSTHSILMRGLYSFLLPFCPWFWFLFCSCSCFPSLARPQATASALPPSLPEVDRSITHSLNQSINQSIHQRLPALAPLPAYPLSHLTYGTPAPVSPNRRNMPAETFAASRVLAARTQPSAHPLDSSPEPRCRARGRGQAVSVRFSCRSVNPPEAGGLVAREA